MTDYPNFRQRLDAVLRTRDIQQVQQFLIAEKQWEEGTPADPEFSMWMMIAGSPSLRDLHEQARTWLVEHGHAEEAQAVLGRGKSAPAGKTGSRRPNTSGGGQRNQNQRPAIPKPKSPTSSQPGQRREQKAQTKNAVKRTWNKET